MPGPSLVELVLTERATVQLHEGDGAPGLVSCCPGLTKLCLVRCQWLGGQAGVEALSRLVHLQHLHLTPFCRPTELAVPDSLHTMSQLTHLELRGSFEVNDNFVQQASRLSNLRGLAFPGTASVTAASLGSLHHLSHLEHLDLSTDKISYSSSNTPSIPRLTKLTHLGLATLGQEQLDPNMLAPLTNLVHLVMDVVPVTSGTELLTVLSTLQKLQELRINSADEHVNGARAAWPPPASPLFGVFADLPDLRALELRWCCSLPARVWEQVFPAGRQLTALTELEICWLVRDEDYGMHSPDALLQSSDLARIISCCPNLVCLNVDIEAGAQVADLAQLSLLPRLQELDLEVQHPGMCIEGLISLTAH